MGRVTIVQSKLVRFASLYFGTFSLTVRTLSNLSLTVSSTGAIGHRYVDPLIRLDRQLQWKA